MRYAAPPTGTLRWQPPHPPATTSGIQPADSEPSVCFFAGQGNQAASPFSHKKSHRKRDLSFTEDCLFLNEANGGVVSVVIQYRLGLFGFLAGKEVKKNGALNVGLCKANHS
ncbi:hypothetical protein C0992_010761 [Termitomyces sp. T32_za158]|nr:hypothetical protein C0992_010761 [Termitomyces sp. T32_za158]